MSNMDELHACIEAITDDEALGWEECFDRFYQLLTTSLQLPCDVTGVEDFQWEGFYVIGPGSAKEHKRLRQTQPSYRDIYELLAVKNGVDSDWMLLPGIDLAAHVRRKSDGRTFYLGLSEIKAVDKKSQNHELLESFADWFVNSR